MRKSPYTEEQIVGITMSSACSANNCFSLRLSSSKNVRSLMPCLRHSSAVSSPASDSFKSQKSVSP